MNLEPRVAAKIYDALGLQRAQRRCLVGDTAFKTRDLTLSVSLDNEG